MLEIKKLDLNYEKHLLYSITGINYEGISSVCWEKMKENQL